MAANFSFVAHAAKRHAHEFSSRGAADRHGQRSLAHARRPEEAENRAFRILHELADGEIFQNALFDFLQAVMIFGEDFFGALDVANFLRALLPGHGQQPVEVVARNGGFGRHRRHHFQPLQLLQGLFLRPFGHAGSFDLLLELFDFVGFAAAQFLLDGLQLFVEVVLFLGALHLALHARIDRAVDVELFDFHFQNVGDAVQALKGLEKFEQFLLFFDGNLQIGGNRVGKLAGIFHAHGGNHRVVIQALRELHVLLEKVGDAARKLAATSGRRLRLHGNQANRGAEKAFVAGHLDDFGALGAFHQNFDVAVGQLHALHDVGERADLIDFFRLGIVDRGVMLRDQENFLVARQRFFERAHGGFAAHDERVHHLREDDHFPHRHHRHALDFEFFLVEHRILLNLTT